MQRKLIFAIKLFCLNNTIFLITPPFTQLNTPYPATAYLKGFLNTKNIASTQADLGIEVILELFSKKGANSVEDLYFEIGKNTISPVSAVIPLLKSTSIFSIMSALAHKENALNLSQGFPDLVDRYIGWFSNENESPEKVQTPLPVL
mgnify:CR=1 FL=1